jgi:hypothetical protein
MNARGFNANSDTGKFVAILHPVRRRSGVGGGAWTYLKIDDEEMNEHALLRCEAERGLIQPD